MRKTWLAVAAIVVAACGGPSGNDPGRYGTVRVARAGDFGAATAPVTDGILAMSAVGPTLQPADATGTDITLEAGADDPLCSGVCGVRYDFAARRAVVGAACAGQPEDYLRRIAAHATGHLLGMGHVAGDAVMRGVTVPTPPAFARECGAEVLGATATPTQADIDEYRRTHPAR
jgi:hypothetical protein